MRIYICFNQKQAKIVSTNNTIRIIQAYLLLQNGFISQWKRIKTRYLPKQLNTRFFFFNFSSCSFCTNLQQSEKQPNVLVHLHLIKEGQQHEIQKAIKNKRNRRQAFYIHEIVKFNSKCLSNKRILLTSIEQVLIKQRQ